MSTVTFSGPGSPPPQRQLIRRFFELNAGMIAACYQREDLCTLLDFAQPGIEDSFIRCRTVLSLAVIPLTCNTVK